MLLHVIVYFSLLRTQTHHVANAHINTALPGFVHESKLAANATDSSLMDVTASAAGAVP